MPKVSPQAGEAFEYKRFFAKFCGKKPVIRAPLGYESGTFFPLEQGSVEDIVAKDARQANKNGTTKLRQGTKANSAVPEELRQVAQSRPLVVTSDTPGRLVDQ
ncbi:hypothetical protein LJR030_005239 [Rhizobium sp. LjRoot30]|uniref:hypothetical protein n=1 Tax=Rhizobium sp. LjRoot30 TaxID=3342320 RepID=UPI003ED0F423